MKGELYENPVSRSTGGLYLPTADVTIGERMGPIDVIFRKMLISAECGIKTSYKVGYQYTDIASSNKEGCHEVDGVWECAKRNSVFISPKSHFKMC